MGPLAPTWAMLITRVMPDRGHPMNRAPGADMSPPQAPPWRGGECWLSLDDGAFLHGEPHPVLALGAVALPVGVRVAVRQTRHVEVFLEGGEGGEGGVRGREPTSCSAHALIEPHRGEGVQCWDGG